MNTVLNNVLRYLSLAISFEHAPVGKLSMAEVSRSRLSRHGRFAFACDHFAFDYRFSFLCRNP